MGLMCRIKTDMRKDNVVIKSVTAEDGPKILKYFQSLGVDTGDYSGSCYEEDGSEFIYYGVINGRFSNFEYEDVVDKSVAIIELPMSDKVTWTREQFKSLHDIACNTWRPKLVEMFPDFAFQDVCEINEVQYTKMYKACTPNQAMLMYNIFGKKPFKKKVMFMCTKTLKQQHRDRASFTKGNQYELVETDKCEYTFMSNFGGEHIVTVGDWADYFYRID